MKSQKRNIFERNPVKSIILIVFVSCIITVFAMEKIIAQRHIIVDFNPKRYIRLKEHRQLLSGFHIHIADSYRKKYLVRTDDNGFILPSKIHNKPDLVIVFLGGSTTECLSVDEENRFPYLAGRLIEKNTKLKVNSYNSGVFGNNSLHSIDILLNKVIPLDPDIVIMMHNMNDLSTLIHEGTYWNKNIYRSPIFELRLTDYLRKIKDSTIPNLYYLLNQTFSLNVTSRVEADEFMYSRGKKLDINKEYLLGQFKMNLRVFINICKARNITPVLMTQQNWLENNPNKTLQSLLKRLEGQGVTFVEFKDIYDSFNQAIREVGTRNNILVIDLDAKVPKDERYMYDCAHLTDNGSRLVAEIISEDLRPVLTDIKLVRKK